MHDDPIPGTELFRNLNPEKQEKVFQAAVDEFASKGYRSASMNSLVRAAGISKGSLFQYFHAKEDLFAAVVDMAAARVKRYLKRVRDETAELTFFERLEWLMRAGFAFIDNHPLLAKIYFHLLQSGEAPFGSERIAELRRQGEGFLADLVRSAQRRGELRESLDTERISFLLNSLLETLLRAYYTEFLAPGLGLYRGDADSLDRWVRTTLDLIRNGLEER
ncbi:MAG: TetR/AcrR family transcriptional regulator [Desulfomonile sp.]|nr:TetR/AcrR family transcriptional regulator [Desulfomonile sp.]